MNIKIEVKCPDCKAPMSFKEAWKEAGNLVVITTECPACGYCDELTISVGQQSAQADEAYCACSLDELSDWTTATQDHTCVRCHKPRR